MTLRERIDRLVRVADRWQEEVDVAATGGNDSELTQEHVDLLVQRISELAGIYDQLLVRLADIEEEVLW